MNPAAGGVAEYLKFRDDLGAFARARIGPRLRGKLDPDDLVQQTLLQACQSRSGCRAELPEQVRAWLRSILTRIVIDHLRKFGSATPGRLEQPLDGAGLGEPLGTAATLADRGSTPSHRASRAERNHLLAEAVGRLPPDQRQAIELRHLRGHSLEEVAVRLGKSGPAVAGLLRRGLLALRADLGPLE